jgi:hypothetical protein
VVLENRVLITAPDQREAHHLAAPPVYADLSHLSGLLRELIDPVLPPVSREMTTTETVGQDVQVLSLTSVSPLRPLLG